MITMKEIEAKIRVILDVNYIDPKEDVFDQIIAISSPRSGYDFTIPENVMFDVDVDFSGLSSTELDALYLNRNFSDDFKNLIPLYIFKMLHPETMVINICGVVHQKQYQDDDTRWGLTACTLYKGDMSKLISVDGSEHDYHIKEMDEREKI